MLLLDQSPEPNDETLLGIITGQGSLTTTTNLDMKSYIGPSVVMTSRGLLPLNSLLSPYLRGVF